MGGNRVLVVGNTVLDVIGKTPEHLPRFGELAAGRGPADIGIGGNGAIAAAAASVMGARATLASAIGEDTWGRWLHQRLDALGVDWRILGKGSNILVADSGVPGAVCRLSGRLSKVRVLEDGRRGLVVEAGGGAALGRLMDCALRGGAGGLAGLSGIPGTVGGAVKLNAGTREGRIGDRLIEVRLLSGRLND